MSVLIVLIVTDIFFQNIYERYFTEYLDTCKGADFLLFPFRPSVSQFLKFGFIFYYGSYARFEL